MIPKRVFIYGMQSSGASLFTYFLGQNPDTVAIVDLWSHCIAPNLYTKKPVVLKATVNCERDIRKHLKYFQPDIKILFIRNPIQNYLSLDVKHYRNWRGRLEDKLKVLERTYLHRKGIFDMTVHFEDFIKAPLCIASKLNEFGLNVPSDATAFNRGASDIVNYNKRHSVWCRNNFENGWGFGNIHFESLKELTPVSYLCNDKATEIMIYSLCPTVMKLYSQATSQDLLHSIVLSE